MTQTTPTVMVFALLAFAGSACNDGSGAGRDEIHSLGAACATDADCGASETCIAQRCLPAMAVVDAGVAFCKVTSDCPAGDVCEHTVCLPATAAFRCATLPPTAQPAPNASTTRSAFP